MHYGVFYEREIHNKTVGVAGKFGVKIASIPNNKSKKWVNIHNEKIKNTQCEVIYELKCSCNAIMAFDMWVRYHKGWMKELGSTQTMYGLIDAKRSICTKIINVNHNTI